MEYSFIVLIIALVASALFSGIEFAFISANKLEMELISHKQGFINKIVSLLYKRPTHFLGTTLLGNNIALVVFGQVFTYFFDPFFVQYFGVENELGILLLNTIFSTLVVLVFGEFIPKSTFGIRPISVLTTLSAPFFLIYIIFYPFVVAITWLTKGMLRLAGIKMDELDPVFTSVDLNEFIKISAERHVEDPEEINTDMVEKALELPQIKLRECMVPRTEIVAVTEDISLQELKEQYIQSRHSKILVYRESIDQIVGYTHHQDMLKKRLKIYDILVLPETLSASEALNLFISEKKSIACVVDEYGGTAGIVTMEDILEEIFGEIEDEHDDDGNIEKQIEEDHWLFSARLEIDFLNEKYDLNLPEGEFETLGGYILDILQRIPEQGELLHLGEYNVLIVSAQSSKIETLELKRIYDSEE